MYLCYVLSPNNVCSRNESRVLSVPSTRFKFLGLLFHIPLLSVKNQTKSWIARDPAPICDPTKQLGWLYFWEKFYSITRNLPAFSDIYTIRKSFISRFERNALWLHFYLVFIDVIGLSKDLAVLNCKVLKEKSPYASSGVYWIDPDGSSRSNALQVYCDQQMDGGGRTLVYSYTFTAYSNLTGARHILMRWSDWCELPTTPHVKIQLFFPLKK